MKSKPRFSEPRVVPREYAGLWIAWNHEGTRIVASGHTFQDTKDAAATAGETDPVFEKAPKAEVRFVGGALMNRKATPVRTDRKERDS